MDFAYIVLTILETHREDDPYALSVRGLRIYSIIVTLLEIAVKVEEA